MNKALQQADLLIMIVEVFASFRPILNLFAYL